MVSACERINMNMAAVVLLKLFSAQEHNSSFRPSPTTRPTTEPFKHGDLIPDVSKAI
jgi:hypothetical protein